VSVLFVTEFAKQVRDEGGYLAPILETPALAEQAVTIGAESAASSAFNAKTRIVRLCADAVCSVAFGASPTASATTARLAKDVPEYFGVQPGHKVAVIQNS
jgi:hypothetical protein